ncbi:type IVB secretion system protein IcmH/DotU [Ideonella sp. DXS29W]|uniref:Type IVB secretion system protein IcmH/DotU n=1 Tax=Ideonella lacteola TaxID=2984193 RepID=A0ABU9BXY4_9BURK
MLLQLARPLLMAVPALRAARPLADPAVLHQALAQALRDFSARARAAGLAAERVMTARYVLCALLDEVATDVLAGHPDGWVRHNLLATFHNQPGGGAKVFVLLNRMSQEPAANLDLLELMDCTLALGFEGPYRRAADGQADLRGLHHRLTQLIAVQRTALDSAAAAAMAAEVSPAAEASWTKRLVNAIGEGLVRLRGLRQALFSEPAMPGATAGVSPLPPGAPPA